MIDQSNTADLAYNNVLRNEGATFADLWNSGAAALQPSADYPWMLCRLRDGRHHVVFFNLEETARGFAEVMGRYLFTPMYVAKTTCIYQTKTSNEWKELPTE